MHACLQHVPAGTPLPASSPPPSARCRLAAVDGSGDWHLILWDDPAAALAEVERTGSGRLLAVEEAFLHAGGHSFAAVVEFDGPRSAPHVAADRFASRQRIAPAAAQVPGTGGAVVLRADDGGMVTVALADSVATLEAASRAILSTPLLPGEDPSLLGGADRWTACRVEGGAALVAALSATASLAAQSS